MIYWKENKKPDFSLGFVPASLGDLGLHTWTQAGARTHARANIHTLGLWYLTHTHIQSLSHSSGAKKELDKMISRSSPSDKLKNLKKPA